MNNEKKPNVKLKRFTAYLIDILIVSVIIVLISQINFINPYKNKYDDVYEDYIAYYQTNIANTSVSTDTVVNNKYINMSYKLAKYGVAYTIVDFVVIMLYFSLFPYFNKNRTIGKQLMNLEIEYLDNNKRLIINIIRSLILPIAISTFLFAPAVDFLNIILICLSSAKLYFYGNMVLTFAVGIYCYVDVIMWISSKENISLHDKLLGTRVVLKNK